MGSTTKPQQTQDLSKTLSATERSGLTIFDQPAAILGEICDTDPCRPTVSDAHVQVIKSITAAMQADYPADFKRLYPANDGEAFEDKKMNSLRLMKRRLYKLLLEFPAHCAADGYELARERKPDFMPTIPAIVAATYEETKKFKTAQKNWEEAETVKLLSNPVDLISCNPLKMLKEAKNNAGNTSVAVEWLKRKSEAEINHNAVLQIYRSKIRTAHGERGCSAVGCMSQGTLSHGTNGQSNFYCTKHFQNF